MLPFASSEVRKCVQLSNAIASDNRRETSGVDLFNAMILGNMLCNFPCARHVDSACNLVESKHRTEEFPQIGAIHDAAYELANKLEHITVYVEHYIIAMLDDVAFKSLFDDVQIDRTELARELLLNLPTFPINQALKLFRSESKVSEFMKLEEQLTEQLEEAIASEFYDEPRLIRARIVASRKQLLVRLHTLWKDQGHRQKPG